MGSQNLADFIRGELGKKLENNGDGLKDYRTDIAIRRASQEDSSRMVDIITRFYEHNGYRASDDNENTCLIFEKNRDYKKGVVISYFECDSTILVTAITIGRNGF